MRNALACTFTGFIILVPYVAYWREMLVTVVTLPVLGLLCYGLYWLNERIETKKHHANDYWRQS